MISAVEALEGRLTVGRFFGYLSAQIPGALMGVLLAHAMFGLPLLQASAHARAGWAQGLSEVIATFGLVLLVLRRFSIPKDQVPWLIGLYILAAYWFTASTSFANPAVTIARSLTDTFAGIRSVDAPAFIVAQILGAGTAFALNRFIGKPEKAYG